MNKKIGFGVRIVLGLCAAMGWWGVLYPELSLTPDTYQIISQTDSVQSGPEVIEWNFDSDIYMEILNADRSQLRFRSKLFQTAEEFFGR